MIRKSRLDAPTTARRSSAHRKARERQQRTAQVLEEAHRLFLRRGYDGTTMAGIAGASGFAVGTLYELFPSKEAILRDLLEDRIDRLLHRLREVAAIRTADPRVQIESIVRSHLGFLQEEPTFLRLTLSAWSGSDFTVRRDLGVRIDRKHREYLALLAPVFARGIRSGVFARRPPIRLAVALTGLLNALIRRWVREPSLDLADEGEAMLSIFLFGITRSERARARGAR